MKKSSEHILQLVTNLLDYQRIESNTWSRKEMNFDFKDLINTTTKSFEPLASKKNIALKVNNQVPDRLMAYGDPFMIRDIYSNIISNAIKYTFEGEVVVTSTFDEDKNMVSLSVKDSGVGIEKKYHALVFEEFEQVSPDNLNLYAKGSGLGLAITKGLVQQLGGEIRFTSEKDVGTEFFVDLPISISKDIKTDYVEGETKYSGLDLKELSILLVDDDPVQLVMASEMLKKHNANVVVESNPNNVMGLLAKQSFDLVFVDIQMPEINGFNLMKQLLDSGIIKDDSIPIIALTGTSELELKDYQDSGFTDFLGKPYTTHQLLDTILKNLNIKHDEQSHRTVPDPKGIEALISYVRDDGDSAIAILEAFVDECSTLNDYLRNSKDKSESVDASNFSHKMLPLFKIMGDRYITSMLLDLDKKGGLPKKELDTTINRIDFYIDQAKNLISTIK